MRTNSIQLRQIMVNHIADFQSPTEYSLESNDWKGLVQEKLKEVGQTGNPYRAAEHQVDGATYLYSYVGITEFMINSLKWNNEKVYEGNPDKPYRLYQKLIGQAYADILSGRLTPQKEGEQS